MLTLIILMVLTLIGMCVDTHHTDSDTQACVLTLIILIMTLIGMCVDTDPTDDSDTDRYVC